MESSDAGREGTKEIITIFYNETISDGVDCRIHDSGMIYMNCEFLKLEYNSNSKDSFSYE